MQSRKVAEKRAHDADADDVVGNATAANSTVAVADVLSRDESTQEIHLAIEFLRDAPAAVTSMITEFR